MTEWNIFWVDVDYWTGAAAAEGSAQGARRLGLAIQDVLKPHAPTAGATVGTVPVPVLYRLDDPRDVPPPIVHPLFFDGSVPTPVHWSRGVLTLQPKDPTPPADIAAAGSRCETRPALLLSVDARGGRDADPAELGATVYRFIGAPQPPSAAASRLEVRGGPLVSLDEECWVFWLNSLLRDASSLSPGEITELLAGNGLAQRGWRQVAAAPMPERDAELSVAGFLLHGGRFEDMFVPAGPGQVSVLFGRNGAGKSLALTEIEHTLRALQDGTPDVHHNAVRPRCEVLLRAGAQEGAPRLFAQILAYAGWGRRSGSSLPDEAISYCQRKMPIWDTRAEWPSGDAPALPVSHAIKLPLAQLRQTVADAIAASMPWAPSVRALAEAIVATPTLSVSANYQVGLTMMPGEPSPELSAAAAEYLAAVRAAEADNRLGSDGDLRRRIKTWARQLVGELAAAPVVVLSARLLPRADRKNGPSGWERLCQAVTEQVLTSTPRPVAFAPGQTTLQPADTAAEETVLALMEHLSVSAKDAGGDPRHPFARHAGHAVRLAELVEHEANQLLPEFVATQGELRIRIADPGEWHAHRVAVSFTGGIGGEVVADALPSGLRTWAIGALSFARARLLEASWTGVHPKLGEFSWSPGDGSARYGPARQPTSRATAFGWAEAGSLTPAVPGAPKISYLLDEPEAHLHLTAQRDVVATAARLASGSCGVLTATHSLSFLDSRAAATHVITLAAADGTISSSASARLEDLAAHAKALGITPSSLALACRGVLLVEGTGDEKVIRRYGGVDLGQKGFIVIPIGGVDYVQWIAKLRFMGLFGIPLHVMFDHLSRRVVQGMAGQQAQPPGEHATKEERKLWGLRQALVQHEFTVNVLPFPHVDIVRAIPESEIAWLLEQEGKGPFIGWQEFDKYVTAARQEAANAGAQLPFYKDIFQAVTKVSVSKAINALAEAKHPGPVSAELDGLLQAMLAYNPNKVRPHGITMTPPRGTPQP